jgi:hypothetical protein
MDNAQNCDSYKELSSLIDYTFTAVNCFPATKRHILDVLKVQLVRPVN